MDEIDGKINIQDLKKNLNKMSKEKIAWTLDEEENPTDIVDWIPTGSKWLDAIVAHGLEGGIPVGRIIEIAGLESTGKSFMAAVIAKNAMAKGIGVVYFDSENALSSKFLQRIGVDIENMLYVPAESCEFVFKTINRMIKTLGVTNYLFIWDSLAMTPTEKDIEDIDNFDPMSSISMQARVVTKGVKKLVVPLGRTNCTFLILNQLKTNINRNPMMALIDPYFTPGGKAFLYAYSLRIWLTKPKSKKFFIEDEQGTRIGTTCKIELHKSRLGSEGRKCEIQLLWGGEDVRIYDEESIFNAIRSEIECAKGWYSFDGEEKFRRKEWPEIIANKENYDKAIKVLHDKYIHNYAKKNPMQLFMGAEDTSDEE